MPHVNEVRVARRKHWSGRDTGITPNPQPAHRVLFGSVKIVPFRDTFAVRTGLRSQAWQFRESSRLQLNS